MTPTRRLDGLRAFVVEDEALIGMMIEDMLQELGCTVIARAARLRDAALKAQTTEADFALLDLNLNGELSFPVADTLVERRMPFFFSTGYANADMPARFEGVPAVRKPFAQAELVETILQVVRRA